MKQYIAPLATGVVAALVALAAALGSGHGVNANEWITIALAFISGTGLVHSVQTSRQNAALEARITTVAEAQTQMENLRRAELYANKLKEAGNGSS